MLFQWVCNDTISMLPTIYALLNSNQWFNNILAFSSKSMGTMISTIYALSFCTKWCNFNDTHKICASNEYPMMPFQWYPEDMLFQWVPNDAISMMLTRYALQMSTQWHSFNDTHKIWSSNEYPIIQLQWFPQDMLFQWVPNVTILMISTRYALPMMEFQ